MLNIVPVVRDIELWYICSIHIIERGSNMVSEELNILQRNLKRDYITKVAKQLFFTKGFENTTIDEIARKAGISKSTLYVYVKGKEDLFVSVHLEGMKLRIKQLQSAISNKVTGFDKIFSFGEVYFDFYKNHPGYFKLHMYEDYNSINRKKVDSAFLKEFDDLLYELIDIVKSSFALGIRDKSIKSSINIGYCDKYLAYNLRTILNVAFSPEKIKQLDADFDEKDFYFQYLNMFMEFIKK